MTYYKEEMEKGKAIGKAVSLYALKTELEKSFKVQSRSGVVHGIWQRKQDDMKLRSGDGRTP